MPERSVAQASPASTSTTSTVKRPRPPILKRPSHTTQNTNSGALLGSPRRERLILERGQPEEAMAACFLQYCAMCESQISTPCSSILYCSEACRRKDSNKPLSAANIMSASVSPPSTPSASRPILQPRTPTGVSQNADLPIVRIPTDNHAFKSDLDPTEWKPKLSRNGRPANNRYNSEAFRYLSSFHRAINKSNDPHDHNDTPDEIRINVPNINMNSAAATAPTTPSLGNSPTTAASSWSLSTSTGYNGHNAYDFNTRPLMPRHNRWYSTSSVGSGVDLVTPHIPPPPANPYAKKDVVAGTEQPRGGIGAFFGGMD